MGPQPTIRAWRPAVAGVSEVLQAHFPEHAYPAHTHDTWTLLLVRRDAPLAHRLRDLLDAGVVDGVALADAARVLGAHPTHLVRAFGREFGLPPHRYLTGRRLDAARRRLLAGERTAEVAAVVGFHDQAHLTRHFRRLLGVTPAAYARSAQ
jgi:AraC-like DNA-binding protein